MLAYLFIEVFHIICMLVCSDRLLIRSSDYYLHMVVSGSALCGGHCANHLELVDIIGKEMKLCTRFQPAQFPAIEKELLKIDEV